MHIIPLNKKKKKEERTREIHLLFLEACVSAKPTKTCIGFLQEAGHRRGQCLLLISYYNYYYSSD